MTQQYTTRYILDANVLLYDPDSIFAYPNAHVIIPLSVIEEIDRFKKSISELGRNARIAAQMLDEFRTRGSLTQGVPLSNGSVLKVFIVEEKLVNAPAFINLNKSSNKTLAATLLIHKKYPQNTFLVTNDINLRVRVSALGIDVVSYEEKNADTDKLYEEIPEISVSERDYENIQRQGYLDMENRRYHANQNIILKVRGSDKKIVARFKSKPKKIIPIKLFPEGVWGVKAKNREQEIALDILMDSSIHLVFLSGKAGTGKTLLALAVALEMMLSENIYQKALVSRPILPMGRDMGYLPGDVDQKMAPWMQPIFDNLEFLSSNRPSYGGKAGGYKRLLDMGLVELEPLTYIRGRSIPHRFMIVDEAQNLTPHELKTIVTRAGIGTKMVFTGDPYQIDNPYVDKNSNGFSQVIEKFRSYDLAAHVPLIHGVRSSLAKLASNIL